MMPVMDGYQLLEKLKSEATTRHIPIIMLTARADSQDRLKALRIGVDDYLTKPFDEAELQVRIANLLRNQSIRKREKLIDGIEKNDQPVLSTADQEWLASFETHVRENLSKSVLSVPALAHTFAMSESTLLRQLKRLTGLTPVQYLQQMRLELARQLLEAQTYRTVAQVANKVGYENAKSFSRNFKKRFGKLPSGFLE
jgi:YesN/AraC family two-component response regulator